MNEFSVFNNQQYLLPCEVEPVCVDADEEIFWVGYASGIIHGYSTNQSNTNRRFEKLVEFKTIWQNILQIASLPKLNRILTVENKNGKKVCRIYHYNLESTDNKATVQSTTLPVGLNVSLISVCKETNGVAVCLGRGVLMVWRFVSSSELPKGTPNPNPEAIICVLKIHTPWKIQFLSMFHNYLVYSTFSNLRVLELVYHPTLSESESGILELEKSLKKQEDDLQNNTNTANTTAEEKASVGTDDQDNPDSIQNLAVPWGVSQMHPKVESIFFEVRFDANTKKLLPSLTLTNLNENKIPKNMKSPNGATSPSDFEEEINEEKGIESIFKESFFIFGESPNVDHPSFIHTDFVSSLRQVLHQHIAPTSSKFSKIGKQEQIVSVQLVLHYTPILSNEEEEDQVSNSERTKTNKSSAKKDEPTPNSCDFYNGAKKNKIPLLKYSNFAISDSKFDENQIKVSQFGVKCVVCTASKAYIFDVVKGQCLNSFEFFGECLKGFANSFYLFSITQSGLEAWSILGNSTTQDFSTQNILSKNFTKDSEKTTNFKGHRLLTVIKPLIGLKGISVTNENVVLYSKIKDEESPEITAVFGEHGKTLVSDMNQMSKIDSALKGSVMSLFGSKSPKSQKQQPQKPQKHKDYDREPSEVFDVYNFKTNDIPSVYAEFVEKAESSIGPDLFTLFNPDPSKIDSNPIVPRVSDLKKKNLEGHALAIKYLAQSHEMLQMYCTQLLSKRYRITCTKRSSDFIFELGRTTRELQLRNSIRMLFNSFASFGSLLAAANFDFETAVLTMAQGDAFALRESFQKGQDMSLIYRRIISLEKLIYLSINSKLPEEPIQNPNLMTQQQKQIMATPINLETTYNELWGIQNSIASNILFKYLDSVWHYYLLTFLEEEKLGKPKKRTQPVFFVQQQKKKDIRTMQFEAISNKILILYKKHAPHKLTSLLLTPEERQPFFGAKSGLFFSTSLAISLIEDVNRNHFLKALKHFQTEKRENATLKALEKWLVNENTTNKRLNNNTSSPNLNASGLSSPSKASSMPKVDSSMDLSSESAMEEDEDFLMSGLLPIDMFALGMLHFSTSAFAKALKVFSAFEDRGIFVDLLISHIPHLFFNFEERNPCFELESALLWTLRFAFPLSFLESLYRLSIPEDHALFWLNPTKPIINGKSEDENCEIVKNTFSNLKKQFPDLHKILEPLIETSSTRDEFSNLFFLILYLMHLIIENPQSKNIESWTFSLFSCLVDGICLSAQNLYIATNNSSQTVSQKSKVSDILEYLSKQNELGNTSDIRQWATFLNVTFIPFMDSWVRDEISIASDISFDEFERLILRDISFFLTEFDIDGTNKNSEDSGKTKEEIEQEKNVCSWLRFHFCAFNALGLLARKELKINYPKLNEIVQKIHQNNNNLEQNLTLNNINTKYLQIEDLIEISLLYKVHDFKKLVVLLGHFDIPMLERFSEICFSRYEEWKVVLEYLFGQIRKKNDRMQQCKQVLIKILWKLSNSVTQEEFVKLIPTDGSFNQAFFAPFIKHCAARREIVFQI